MATLPIETAEVVTDTEMLKKLFVRKECVQVSEDSSLNAEKGIGIVSITGKKRKQSEEIGRDNKNSIEVSTPQKRACRDSVLNVEHDNMIIHMLKFSLYIEKKG